MAAEFRVFLADELGGARDALADYLHARRAGAGAMRSPEAVDTLLWPVLIALPAAVA